MALIHVPRIDLKAAMDRNRPVNALLRMQVEHLHEAEMKLPVGRQTDVYINAIKTEGEAAQYMRRVTEAIQGAHAAAETRRAKAARKTRRVIEIAAVAEEKSVRRGARKKSKGKVGRKR